MLLQLNKHNNYNFFQSWPDPASNFRGAISVIFGCQVSLNVHYFKRDYTSKHCCDKKLDDKMALNSECCFPNCTKAWCKKLLF